MARESHLLHVRRSQRPDVANDVLPREVVNAVGGGLAVQGGVGSVVVVVVEPGLVGGLALGLAGVGVSVGPLADPPTSTSPNACACYSNK